MKNLKTPYANDDEEIAKGIYDFVLSEMIVSVDCCELTYLYSTVSH
ncbi:hypothetical protein [Anaerocolumna jejuensis]